MISGKNKIKVIFLSSKADMTLILEIQFVCWLRPIKNTLFLMREPVFIR